MNWWASPQKKEIAGVMRTLSSRALVLQSTNQRSSLAPARKTPMQGDQMMGETPENIENEVKLRALIDNTAQGIFNYLKEIENKREVFEKRWIWELMQNALDASPQEGKIRVNITKTNDQLVFTHNGRRFKPEEVAHLVYHGSTKKEQAIGKFGTGFLVTHLLSKRVKLRGIREDGNEFEFWLNRNGASPDDIKKLMEETWANYQNSLVPVTGEQNYTARFEYPLNETILETVKAGIEVLKNIAPYVIAFNDKLGTIGIEEQETSTTFELVNQEKQDNHIIKTVQEKTEGVPSIFHELLIAKNQDVEIAIKYKKQSDKTLLAESLNGIPRIFLAFPLFGTDDLPFPVVVNSRRFEPTEKRDGIFLGVQDTEEIELNRMLIETASGLFVDLISNPGSEMWHNIHTLLILSPPPAKDWLDGNWYADLLKRLVHKIMGAKIMLTQTGIFVCPESGFVPIAQGPKEELERLWDLCWSFSSYKDKMPAKTVAFEWAKIFAEWESLGVDLGERKIMIETIADEIAACGNLKELKTVLTEQTVGLDMLNEFYELLLKAEEESLFSSKSILPNQNEILEKKPKLLKDDGIEESIKDICSKLGADIRGQLLHAGVCEECQNLLPCKSQDQALNEAIGLVRKPKTDNDDYVEANVDLLSWLVNHDKFEHLEGYPLLCCEEKRLIFLSTTNEEKPLAPKEIWNEIARGFYGLFPSDGIISSSYIRKMPERNQWTKLESQGLILADPLYKENTKLSREELEALLLSKEVLDEEKEHESIAEIELNKIAYLETKDKGIIDTARKSKEKVRKSIEFFFSYVVERDNQWDKPTEIDCKCGSKHSIWPAFWIVPLKNRSWVPVRRDKSEKPSAQYLAAILEGQEVLLDKCRQDKPSKLLAILDVSIGELMMHVAAKDDAVKQELDKAMGSLFSTFMDNPSQLSKIAQLAQNDSDLLVQEVEKRIQIREQIRRNQSIGSLVETLLKNILESESLKVERTGVGSDYVVENDFVSNNIETVFEVKKDNKTFFFIEVKATTQDFVRMTVTQAQEAVRKSLNYALCVIRIDASNITEDDIKDTARFVIDIGPKIEDKVRKARNLQEFQDNMTIADDIEIEIEEGPVRFRINRQIWSNAYRFEQFVGFIKGAWAGIGNPQGEES